MGDGRLLWTWWSRTTDPWESRNAVLASVALPVPASLAISGFPAFLLAGDAKFPANAVSGRIHCRKCTAGFVNRTLAWAPTVWADRLGSYPVCKPPTSRQSRRGHSAISIAHDRKSIQRKEKNGLGLDRSRSDFAGPQKKQKQTPSCRPRHTLSLFSFFLFHLARYYSPLDESTASDMLCLTNALPPCRSLPER